MNSWWGFEASASAASPRWPSAVVLGHVTMSPGRIAELARTALVLVRLAHARYQYGRPAFARFFRALTRVRMCGRLDAESLRALVAHVVEIHSALPEPGSYREDRSRGRSGPVVLVGVFAGQGSSLHIPSDACQI
jgi:hypothetical protein